MFGEAPFAAAPFAALVAEEIRRFYVVIAPESGNRYVIEAASYVRYQVS